MSSGRYRHSNISKANAPFIKTPHFLIFYGELPAPDETSEGGKLYLLLVMALAKRNQTGLTLLVYVR